MENGTKEKGAAAATAVHGAGAAPAASGSKRSGSGFHLRIITPEQLFYDGWVGSVILDTVDGQMGFLKDRAPVCTLLKPDGKARLRPSSGKSAGNLGGGPGFPGSASADEAGFLEIHLAGGFAHMNEDLLIYTDGAIWKDEADEDGLKSFRIAMGTSAAATQAPVELEKLTPNTPPKD